MQLICGRSILASLVTLGISCGCATADLVTDWNSALLEAIRTETTPPCLASRNLAMLHVAIYDAANAITKRYEPFHFQGQAPSGASVEAAVTAAAYDVSSTLFPSRVASFDLVRSNALNAIPDDESKTKGLAFGRKVAEDILNWRSDDGASTTLTYIPRSELGQWRRTPPFFRPPEMTQWARLKPFAMTNCAQFRPPPPPALDSQRYAEDVNEVRRLGGAKSLERTREQSDIARFWSDFSYTMTPPGHWNLVAQNLTANRQLSLTESARLFALLNIASADAAIVAWDAKYTYNFWRPVTAIQAADLDRNSEAQAGHAWMPLLNTPAFPEYVSGHSTFSGAAAVVLSRCFGTDKVRFEITSDSLPGVIRTYESFSQAAEEIGRSRIYGGIHFPSADVEGRRAGRALGDYVASHCLQPINSRPTLRAGSQPVPKDPADE